MYTEHDPELEQQPRRKAPAAPAPETPKPAAVKQSYESSPEVQRWLQEHAVETGGVKAPFDPTLLSGRRDRDWILSSLAHFYHEDLIADVLQVVKSGKEATVFCCAADPATGAELLAAKIYRPRMFRSLSNDAVYRESRTQHDVDGGVVRGDGRRRRAGKNTRGRAAQVRSWIDFEFETQQILHAAGASVPRPWSRMGNAVLMDYVGDADGPAPLLYEVRIDPADAPALFEGVIREIELWLACDRVHGDLSAYNILYWAGRLTIIDFAQALDPRHNPAVFELFARDVERVYRYFARYGVAADPGAIAISLWRRYMGGQL